jgi:hypothetical protein
MQLKKQFALEKKIYKRNLKVVKKVFISYAHESDQLSDNVLDFSNFLRSKNIDSEIDQYEEAPSEGWPKWMLRQIQEADYVLVACSKLFYERANDVTSSTDGLGVKWETNLILQLLYTMSTNNVKFIPIIFNSNEKDFIPLPLQPYTYYNISNIQDKEKLKNRLLGIAGTKRPELGKEEKLLEDAESLTEKSRKTMFISSIIDLELWDKAKWKGIAFASDPSLKTPPIIGFVFEDEKYGNKIFSNLKTRFGDIDKKEEIRLSLINNISGTNPQYYKVHLGTDWDVVSDKLKENNLEPTDSYFTTITRFHEMNPQKDSTYLEVFKHAYLYAKKYYITNVNMENGQPVPNFENMIEKIKISFRQKSDIVDNPNDQDIVVFKELTKI